MKYTELRFSATDIGKYSEIMQCQKQLFLDFIEESKFICAKVSCHAHRFFNIRC